jgi:hypothetical protein
MNQKILTFTMSNITVKEYYLQSPAVLCSVDVRENDVLTLNVTRYWVQKGHGKVEIIINNYCDFRTLIQLDIENLLVNTIDKICEISTIKTATIYDDYQCLNDCESSDFQGIWQICNNGILVKDRVFDLMAFRACFHIDDIFSDY